MNFEETKKVVFVMTKAYPKYFGDYTQADLKDLVSLWQQCMQDLQYVDVNNALITYLNSNECQYPPQCGNLRQIIMKKANVGSKLADAETAWQMIIKIIRTRPRDEYPQAIRELPKAIRDWVGSSSTLESYANMDSTTLHGVVHSQFIKSYNAKVQQAMEQASTGNGSILIDEHLGAEQAPQIETANSFQRLMLVDGIMKVIE